MPQQLTYAGDISPTDCWTLLKHQGAVLVDVRTKEEWLYVGVPVVEEGMNPPIFQQWQTYPQMEVAENYCENLTKKLDEIGGDIETNLCFLCRSGVRSQSAAVAMTQDGFKKCFNIASGFEGRADENGQRGNLEGWKFENLAWRQS